MDTILKVESEGDLRRALLTGLPSYADIERAVSELWPGRNMREAKYLDDEGDLCSLTEFTMSDFLVTAKTSNNGKGVLRLQLIATVPTESADNDASLTREPFSEPWQHVEQVNESGSDCLHTVADLTDSRPPELDTAVEDAQQESLAKEYPIHTPELSPVSISGQFIKADELSVRLESVDSERTTIANQESTECTTSANQNATSAASVFSGDVTEELIIDHGTDEQIELIIVAFDEDENGHLNFKEFNVLHHASWGGELSFEQYKRMCLDEGEDVDVGLGREALMCIYSRCRDLERDFYAAKRKLDGTEEEERRNSQNGYAQANPINLMFKNPLLAVPFALDATERVRQRVASQLSFRK
jgi:hypothetical protein